MAGPRLQFTQSAVAWRVTNEVGLASSAPLPGRLSPPQLCLLSLAHRRLRFGSAVARHVFIIGEPVRLGHRVQHDQDVAPCAVYAKRFRCHTKS